MLFQLIFIDEEEKNVFHIVIVIAILLGTIVGYFIISLIRQHKKNLQLYRKSVSIEINTLEKERKRMAADLHDEIGPVLSAIKLKLNSLDLSNNEDEEEVEKTNIQIDRLMKRMREISFDLMPSSLTRKGLIPAINEFIDYISRKNNLDIKFDFEELNLSQNASINIYRIFQEIIHNTIKHSGASILFIEIKKVKNNYQLITRDNGKGFNYDLKVKESEGLGLKNLLTRIDMIGGKMFFESGKDGTQYIFEIPITNNLND